MSYDLSPPQFHERSKALTSRLQMKAGIGGKSNSTNTSTRLAAVGVGTSEMQLAPMLRFEIVSKSDHGCTGGAMLLKESNIGTPLSKALSIRGEVGDVLGLDDGEASARHTRKGGIRYGMNKTISLVLHR